MMVKIELYVLGCQNLLVATDHKPLVPILNNKRLDAIKNPRILNFKEKMLMYDFHAQHIPGSLNFAPDATSRHPSEDAKAHVYSLFRSDNNPADTESDVHQIHEALVNAVKAMDDEVVTWEQVREAAAGDAICYTLCDASHREWLPSKESRGR